MTLVAAGCSKGFEVTGVTEISQTGTSSGSANQFKYQCANPAVRGSNNSPVRRLSKQELQNTLTQLLGATASDDTIAGALETLPPDEVKVSTEDFSPLHPTLYAAALKATANRVIEIAKTTATLRTAIYGACANQATITDACAAAFIQNYGQKVYRRPLTVSETKTFNDLYASSGKALTGLHSVLFVLLQAPPLAFHLETGESVSNGRTRLTDYEIANRIAYLTTASPPDKELSDAASRTGELQDLVEVKKQVSRLLSSSSPAARARMSSFLKFYAGKSELEDPNPGLGLAAKIETAGLGEEMMTELSEYSENIFWKSTGTFEELMTSRDSFPRSDAMVKILGAANRVPASNAPVEASPVHIGFLHRPAFLANPGNRTSPILRGVHVRSHVLCEVIPFPTSSTVDDALDALGDIEGQTNRSKVNQMTNQPACIGCHAFINPLGFTFEKYDQLGMPRAKELIYDDLGKLTTTWDVDTKVDQPRLDFGEKANASVPDSIQLAYAISKGSKGRACFAQKAFEFTRARTMKAEDACALHDAELASHNGTLRDVLVESIANEDIFWLKSN